MCERVGDGTFAIVCGGHRRRPALCQFCQKAPHTKLCDAPLFESRGHGRVPTCDAKMCDACATNAGPDRDLCPKHRGDLVNFPATRSALQVAGYKFQFSRACKRCQHPLEFWSMPNKKLAPLEVITVRGLWMLDSHFKTCPFAEEFKTSAPGSASPAPAKQGDLFGGKK